MDFQKKVVNKPVVKPNEQKKITYDDILSNMGMVNIDGKLQFVSKTIKKDSICLDNNNNTGNKITPIMCRDIVVNRMLETNRINKIKSKKLLLSNGLIIQCRQSILDNNRLFNFSKR